MVEKSDRRKDTKLEYITKFMLELEGAIVVTALLCMLAGTLWYLLNHDLPKTNEIIISMIVGMLVTKIGTIVDFRYGGSQQSRKQTETNATLARTAQMAQATLSAATGTTPGKVELQPGDQVSVEATDTGDTNA